MIREIKRLLYFPIAYYFRFWAQIQLSWWKPVIIVITGSSGKTTLLHLIESQLGNKAKYSHHANSSYGIPFDILGLSRKKLTSDEWIFLFLLAPFKAFKLTPKEKLYIIEADCDRPGEGKFLASLLNPAITLFINSSLTHSANFDCLVKNNLFSTAEEAIAQEFGSFLQYTKKLAIVNGNNPLIQKQLKRISIPVRIATDKVLDSYKINENSTDFIIEHKKCSINFLIPKDVFYSIQMTNLLMKALNLPFDPTFKNLILPPGRNSLFKGIRNTKIIDSTYNATPDGVKTILEMFDKYPSENKWIVLGDMIELGAREKEEHEKLADLINSMKLKKIILIGPRVSKHTYPKLNPPASGAEKFVMPKDGLDYIIKNISGGETILFKGARFLEGIIERLLQNKEDVNKLVRREKVWQNRRRSFGL
ncbi:MAG: cyanophycin synthetase [Candidatus Levybacteria bacterium]|nr:cyanophycin synthetase [Candidatus Levybacteria bacterium]